jgi:hypothetical protein
MEERANDERTNTEATGGTAAAFLYSSTLIVVLGILVVGGLAALALLRTSGDSDAMVSALTAGTGVIGTLVGAFLGLKLGTEDKGRVADQAEEYRRQSDQLVRALAVLPPEQAQAVFSQVDEPSAPGESPGPAR